MTTEPDPSGVVFDDRGEAWPAEEAKLAERLGHGASFLDVIANAVSNFGFVHVAPIRNAVAVTFDPSVVSPLAAVAAFYEIAAHAPQYLILISPGKTGASAPGEVFRDVAEGLKRLEEAATRRRDEMSATWQDPGLGLTRPRLAPNPRLLRTAARGVVRPRPVQIRSRTGDHAMRLARPLDAIAPEDDWLGQLLGFWRGARRPRRLPGNESLDWFELLNIARGRAHIVDTNSSTPTGYRFRVWGAVNSYGGGYANRALGEMPAGVMRDEALEDYRQAVSTGAPSYHLIDIVERKSLFSYARLLLPLAQDGRRVDRLIVLINERPLPDLTTS